MNNNIFISNLKTNRHGRGVLSYRELDYEQGEYVVDNVEPELLNMRRNTSAGYVIFCLLFIIINIVIVYRSFLFSVLIGSLLVGVNGGLIIAIGTKSIKQFSKGPVFESAKKLEYPKERLTATVTNTYRITENRHLQGYGENVMTQITSEYTVFEWYYEGVHYLLERKSDISRFTVSNPKINEKRIIFFDKKYPARSLMEDDIKEKKGIFGGIFLILFGALWLGLFIMSLV